MDNPGDLSSSSSVQHDSVLQWSAVISAADRLAIRAGDTIQTIARLKRAPGRRGLGFPPSIASGQLQTLSSYHATTSAQCIVALQSLHGAVDSLRAPARPPSATPVGPRDRPLKPEKFRANLRTAINGHLPALGFVKTANRAIDRLSSDEFGTLNPLTCAHVLRALTPSSFFIDRTWWWAFFSVFEALNRHAPSPDSTSGASVQDWQPTAVVSAICIDTIVSVLDLLHRRRLRLRRLIDLVKSLQEIDRDETAMRFLNRRLKEGFRDRRRLNNQRLLQCLDEFEVDTALPDVWVTWRRLAQPRLQRGTATGDFLARCFGAAVRDPNVSKGLKTVIKRMNSMMVELSVTYVGPFEALARHLAIQAEVEEPSVGLYDRTINIRKRRAGRTNRRVRKPGRAQLARIRASLRWLNFDGPPYAGPGWFTSLRAAFDALGSSGGRGAAGQRDLPLSALTRYWRDHAGAAKNAQTVSRHLARHLKSALEVYLRCRGVRTTDLLISGLEEAVSGLDSLGEEIIEAIWPTARWAESVMTRHMAYFHSDRWTSFDAAELAYAAYTIVRSGPPYDVNTILSALEVVSKVQRADGTWGAQQAVVWRQSGMGAYAHTAQVAFAIASTIRVLVGGDEVFASRPAGLLSRLAPIEAALNRTVDWLAGTQQSFPWPPVLRPRLPEKDGARSVVGWCSDRGVETDRIDLSVTANVIDFLLVYRQYSQARINIALTELFSAYSPADLTSLMDVKPTDLDKPFDSRLIPRLVSIVGNHTRSRLSALSWNGRDATDVAMTRSMILAGPPGTSKTTLARAIAHELEWPLIALSPSDFLRRGEENVEARAREIFQYLSLGSHVLYLFDEVDELLLARQYQQREPLRSVFSFLTPSFLTKLQDLHDAAKRNSIMFVIGTNYFERIDPAAKRGGRIDETFEVLYPDRRARIAIVIEKIREKVSENGGTLGVSDRLVRQFAARVADATELFSYNGLVGVCSWLVKETDAAKRDKGLEDIGTGDGLDGQLKPEIDLSLYYRRPGAVEEFLNILAICAKRMGDTTAQEDALKAFWGSIPRTEQPFWLKRVKGAVDSAANAKPQRRIRLNADAIQRILQLNPDPGGRA